MPAPIRPLAQLVVDSVVDYDEPPGRPLDPALHDISADSAARAAVYHRVGSAMARICDRRTGVPAEWPEMMNRLRNAQRVRHLRSREDLRIVQDRLDAIGVTYVAAKGPVLADLLWPQSDLRDYYDLDLFVAPSDFPRALEALEPNCELLDRNWPLLRREMRAELALVSPLGTPLDLHWHIAVPADLRATFPFDIDAMLGRRRRAELSNGLPTSVFDPADTLLHLAFHAAHAGMNRLVWAADIWFAARQLTADDWTEVRVRARAARAEVPLALALRRTVGLFGTPPDLDDRVLAPADRLWGYLTRWRDRHVPWPGLPSDPHLGGLFYANARRSVPASVVAAVRSRRTVARLEAADEDFETESQALSRDVPDAEARAAYLSVTAASR